MSLNKPTIDSLEKIASNKYALSVLVAKRAKELTISRADFFFENCQIKPITVAAEEVYEGKIKMPKK